MKLTDLIVFYVICTISLALTLVFISNIFIQETQRTLSLLFAASIYLFVVAKWGMIDKNVSNELKEKDNEDE